MAARTLCQARCGAARLEGRIISGPALARRLVSFVARQISLQEGFFRHSSHALEDDDGFSLEEHRMVEIPRFGKGHRVRLSDVGVLGRFEERLRQRQRARSVAHRAFRCGCKNPRESVNGFDRGLPEGGFRTLRASPMPALTFAIANDNRILTESGIWSAAFR